jgi:hypothetical protein
MALKFYSKDHLQRKIKTNLHVLQATCQLASKKTATCPSRTLTAQKL